MATYANFFGPSGWYPSGVLSHSGNCAYTTGVGVASKSIPQPMYDRYRTTRIDLSVSTDYATLGKRNSEIRFVMQDGSYISIYTEIYETIAFPSGRIRNRLFISTSYGRTGYIKFDGSSISIKLNYGYITISSGGNADTISFGGNQKVESVLIVGNDDGGGVIQYCSLSVYSEELLSVDSATWPVADIIRDISARAGVTEDLLNMTEIFGDKYPVYGCFATPDDDAYTLIEELQKLHMFDPCNFDGRLNFIKRGGDVVADIPIEELVDNNKEIDKRERKDAIEVPRVLNLEYYDINGDLAPNKQISDRSLDIRAKDEEKQETAVILSADQAAQMATITHKVMIEEQGGGYEFSLPDSYAWLTTGDVIRLDGLRLRITEVEIDEGLQNYKTVLDRASAYTSSIPGVPPSDPVEPEDETAGETVFEFLDIPILSDADDRLLFYSAVNGYDNWRGAGVDLSLDGGANYIDSDSSETPSTIGYLETDLQAGSVYYPDSVNSVRVRLILDDLEIESATLAEMQNRKNLCAIGNELVNFGNVTEIEPGLWELDYFLRGRKGTVSEFHPAGERLVMLRRPVLATVPAETYLLNQELTFRATSIGNDTPSAIKTYLYEGVSQRERMPGYLRAVNDSGNIIISWQGVGRIGAGANVSQSQHWRGYRVYVNGVAQPDQLTAGLTVADPGGSVTIEVCQLNQFTGEGPRASITI